MIQKAFKQELRITDSDIDQLGHVNNVVYLKWAQDAAEAHWNQLASDKEREGIAWVVLRHEIDYKHAAKPGVKVYAITWVGDTSGVKSVRHVRIFQEPDKLLAEVKTTWCLIDRATQRPMRIDDRILSFLNR